MVISFVQGEKVGIHSVLSWISAPSTNLKRIQNTHIYSGIKSWTGKHKHRAVQIPQQSMLPLTCSLEEKVLSLLLYWVSSRVKTTQKVLMLCKFGALNYSELTATKACSQIGRKWKALFELQVKTCIYLTSFISATEDFIGAVFCSHLVLNLQLPFLWIQKFRMTELNTAVKACCPGQLTLVSLPYLGR